MAVKTKEEILSSLKERFKDDTSDDALSFIEDVSDTIDDLGKQVTDAGGWKAKYEENDKAWREKYRDRFFNPPADGSDNTMPANTNTNDDSSDDEQKPMNFEDLFESK